MPHYLLRNMALREAGWWLVDYVYAARRQWKGMFYSRPPARWASDSSRPAAIVIPGILCAWSSLMDFCEKLCDAGYAIYVVEALGRNTMSIKEAAARVSQYLEEKNLRDVVIVGHSKGGLIGKYILDKTASAPRVKKLIAISTPFHGSEMARFIPLAPWRELCPESDSIRDLEGMTQNNGRIVSIYGVWDNHVRPHSSMYLAGAKNIQIDVAGHTKILLSEELFEIVKVEVS